MSSPLTVRWRSVRPAAVVALIADLLGRAGVATCAIGGHVGFRVHRSDGGTWVCDLATAGGAWSCSADPSAFERCDARLYAFSSTFAAIVIAPELIEGLRETGELVVEGRTTMFERLGELVAGGGNLLELRFKSAITENTTRA